LDHGLPSRKGGRLLWHHHKQLHLQHLQPHLRLYDWPVFTPEENTQVTVEICHIDDSVHHHCHHPGTKFCANISINIWVVQTWWDSRWRPSAMLDFLKLGFQLMLYLYHPSSYQIWFKNYAPKTKFKTAATALLNWVPANTLNIGPILPTFNYWSQPHTNCIPISQFTAAAPSGNDYQLIFWT